MFSPSNLLAVIGSVATTTASAVISPRVVETVRSVTDLTSTLNSISRPAASASETRPTPPSISTGLPLINQCINSRTTRFETDETSVKTTPSKNGFKRFVKRFGKSPSASPKVLSSVARRRYPRKDNFSKVEPNLAESRSGMNRRSLRGSPTL